MSELDATDAADQLLGMTNLFQMTMDRRRARPAGEPTRLQSFLLMAIARHGTMTVSELVPLLDVSPATTSQMVGTLETRGWVSRAFDPEDHRRHVLELTVEGQAMMERSRMRRRERLREILSRLSGTDRAELVRLAERVAAAAVEVAGSHPEDPQVAGGEA
ncbi:MAG: MarR family transcriptional regulator [Thermaerobacter sp.]|nr:MarR family transcriptional regulator [Thermaerobacter sp.]